jgi:hypothetical protein
MRYLVFAIVFVMPLQAVAVEPTSKQLIIQPDAFQTLVNPQCSYCRDEAKRRSKELRGDERSVGLGATPTVAQSPSASF